MNHWEIHHKIYGIKRRKGNEGGKRRLVKIMRLLMRRRLIMRKRLMMMRSCINRHFAQMQFLLLRTTTELIKPSSFIGIFTT